MVKETPKTVTLVASVLASLLLAAVPLAGLLFWNWNYFGAVLLFWLQLNLGRLRKVFLLAVQAGESGADKTGNLVWILRVLNAFATLVVLIISTVMINLMVLHPEGQEAWYTFGILLLENQSFLWAAGSMLAVELVLLIRDFFILGKDSPEDRAERLKVLTVDDGILAACLAVAVVSSLVLASNVQAENWPNETKHLVLSLPAVTLVLASAVVKIFGHFKHWRRAVVAGR